MNPVALVRTAGPGERRTVETLIRACGPGVRHYFDMRYLDDYYQRGWVYVACDHAEQMMGFAVVRPLRREPVVSVYELGVAPGARRRAVGSLLLRAVARGRTVRLVVDAANTSARAFYTAAGLQVVQHVTNRRGEELVKMAGQPR